MIRNFQVKSISIGIGNTGPVITWYRINTKYLQYRPPLAVAPSEADCHKTSICASEHSQDNNSIIVKKKKKKSNQCKTKLRYKLLNTQ